MFLIDGTYELFRQFFGRPSHLTKDLDEVSAVRGVLGSTLQLFETGATHLGVATDHVIESFRNRLYTGYKTGAGIDPTLFAQFPILEDALRAMGVAVWAMVELEADDALASAAKLSSQDDRVEQAVILTPDKDLAQCVVRSRVVQVDRRNNKVFDEAGVLEKFGVLPESIADYLALVGDSADGFPGIQGWGAKSTATVLRKFVHLEDIPESPAEWGLNVRSSATLAGALNDQRDLALLFKDLATLRVDEPLFDNVDSLRWQGPTDDFASICERLEAPGLVGRAQRIAGDIRSNG